MSEPQEYPLAVTEQTMLNEPIKIGWPTYQASRQHFEHSIHTAFAEADADQPLAGTGYRALDRQQTNVIVLTVEEAESLLYELGQYLAPYGIEPPKRCPLEVYERVAEELTDTLTERGYVLSGGARGSTIQNPDGTAASDLNLDADPEADPMVDDVDDDGAADESGAISTADVAATMQELNIDPGPVLEDIRRADEWKPDDVLESGAGEQ